MKKIFIFIMIIFMIFLSSCNNDNKEIKYSYYDEYNMPHLTEEGIERIKKDYKSFYKAKECNIYRFLGEYHGTLVVQTQKGGLCAVEEEKIEDITFVYPYIGNNYRVNIDGKFYSLTEAYNEKIITYDDLLEIKRVDNLAFEFERVDVWGINDLWYLTISGEKMLKEAYLEQVLKDDKYQLDDIYVEKYGCSIAVETASGGASGKPGYVFLMNYEGSGLIPSKKQQTIAGYTFEYIAGGRLMIYYEGKIYDLEEMYNDGLIKKDRIELINSYFYRAYTLDWFLKDQEEALEAIDELNVKEEYIEKVLKDKSVNVSDIVIDQVYPFDYSDGIKFLIKFQNNKQIITPDYEKTRINGIEVMIDKNNPVYYIKVDNGNIEFNPLEEAYDKGEVSRMYLNVINYYQENVYELY
ncbi:MAG: hypothetical protein IJX78_03740 [Bacilli bacterium]|nr:hypothetical protein [Bacilli bacterium]